MSYKKLIYSFHRYIDRYYDLTHVITVSATIADDFIHSMRDHKGALHQHFFIDIENVLDGGENPVEKKVFVAARYGDKSGLKEPVRDLAPGNPIVLRGKYIPTDEAYKTGDNPGFPVLHFTHHPVGYIIYNGVKYE